MKCWITLVIVLLLVAVPLRGFAAVSVALCGGGDHEGGFATWTTVAHEAVARESATGSHAYAHASNHDHATSSSNDPAKSTTPVHSCTCAGAPLLVADSSSLIFPPVGAEKIPAPDSRYTGYVPATPERPPLTLVA